MPTPPHLPRSAEQRDAVLLEAAGRAFADPATRERLSASFAVLAEAFAVLDREITARMSTDWEQMAAAVEILQSAFSHALDRARELFGPNFREFLQEAIPQQLAPPNLRSVWEQVEPYEMLLLAQEGIPLYLTPRASIALELLDDDQDDAAHRTVLGSRFHDLLEDCDAVLAGCDGSTWAEEVLFLRGAVAAARAGHTAPAQALAASVLDTLFRRYESKRARSRRTARDKNEPLIRAVEGWFEEACVWLPVWHAYAKFDTDKGDPVPGTFARHASAHAVGRRQYNERNCVLGCMVATSLVGYLQGKTPRPAPTGESATPK